MIINEVGKIYTRPWGTYRTLEFSEGYQVKVITVSPRGCLSLQKHFKRAEHWVVVKGRPTLTIGEEIKEYEPNQHVFIPVEKVHRIENQTNEPVEIIEVQVGSYLGEDDIVRLEDIYDR
jgi:mannose-6-phosphate isomerase